MVCPGALAMIGVYGSMLTGDVHEKSDLDLLIVINDAIFPDYLVEYEKTGLKINSYKNMDSFIAHYLDKGQ